MSTSIFSPPNPPLPPPPGTPFRGGGGASDPPTDTASETELPPLRWLELTTPRLCERSYGGGQGKVGVDKACGVCLGPVVCEAPAPGLHLSWGIMSGSFSALLFDNQLPPSTCGSLAGCSHCPIEGLPSNTNLLVLSGWGFG